MSTELPKDHSWFAEILHQICRDQGIALRGLSQNWLWELEKDGVTKRILGMTFDLNASIASSIGRDKVATFELLKAYDVSSVPHYVAWLQKGGEMVIGKHRWSNGVVVKPLNGQGGRGVRLFYDQHKALTYMSTTTLRWAVSPFVAITTELRAVLLDGEVLLHYAKQSVSEGGLKIFKLSEGAKLIRHDLTTEEETLAQAAQKALGLRVCAVDMVRLESGELRVLEINSTITLAPFAAQSAENAKQAKKAYGKIIAAMFA